MVEVVRRNRCTEELKKPWMSRVRMDRAVTGAIELAFLRGYQAGYEDRRDGNVARYYVTAEVEQRSQQEKLLKENRRGR